ncbi:ADP-ribosyltransferase [Streptomyces sp. DSM 44915]|uniref:ADP-ribosyltransferase n=1 Tax=Streptomyces chisholmiae TaxID=3075540 RepID=A0ABU2JV65_9ACTN|nr:ADP-ribosyltransferase [Streptomyces sp. DSM 44915]MDT0268835.1 ADP-ribosyltransferase [Streptomyces sp. DSM 44915]
MTVKQLLRRAALAALPVALLLTPVSLTAAPVANAAVACPTVEDPLYAANNQAVEVERISPDPSFRTDCRQLYRADGRAPEVVFAEGFEPRDVTDGQYDLEQYVLVNQPSPFVSTSYDHDLYKNWRSAGYNYYIDAPGGIDVNATIGDQHRWADQEEVAFPGGIATEFIVGACPVDSATRTEIMTECVDNPHYEPWRG